MINDRLGVLAKTGAIDAMGKLLASPDVRQLTALVTYFIAPAPKRIKIKLLRALCEEYEQRDADVIGLAETELDPETLGLLDEIGVSTIGEARKRTDAELYKTIPTFDLRRLEELRAVCAKYVRLRRCLPPPEKSLESLAAGGRSRGERIEAKIVEALRRGETPKQVAVSLRVERERVAVIDKRLKAAARRAAQPTTKLKRRERKQLTFGGGAFAGGAERG